MGKTFHIWKGHLTMTEEGKKLLIWKCHVAMIKKEGFKSNKFYLLNHSFSFIVRIYSLFPATSVLSAIPMAYNTTASLDKLTCSVYVDIGRRQHRLRWFSSSENDSNYLDVQFKVFNWDDNRYFHLVSTGSYDWGISWSLQQKFSVERETCHQCWNQQCPTTWMNNSHWLTRWLTWWIKQLERLLWLCCGTIWNRHRVHMSKSDNLQVRKMMGSFNNLSMRIINLINLSNYLMYWNLYLIKLLIVDTFVISCKSNSNYLPSNEAGMS